jgi:hypothetical protein
MKRVSEFLKKYLWVFFLVAFLAFLGAGLYRGEAIEVFEKARTICLECIGIG